MAPFGGQSTLATGIFGAVGVLLALIERDKSGSGELVEVSAQEVLTQALETSIPEYELTGRVQRRLGDVPREAGSGIYRLRGRLREHDRGPPRHGGGLDAAPRMARRDRDAGRRASSGSRAGRS